jgi:hypothetical protein
MAVAEDPGIQLSYSEAELREITERVNAEARVLALAILVQMANDVLRDTA